MRRATVQAVRLARRPVLRKAARPSAFTSSYGLGSRHFSLRRTERVSPAILKASMNLRAYGAAFLSAAVASGAYYAYNAGHSMPGDLSTSASVSVSVPGQQSRPFTASDVYSTSPQAKGPTASAEDAARSTRRAVVVEQGSLYTGTLSGDGPLAKETDDYGRKVLEMLTPEQATQKLRRNEQSWLVERGKGVVRYDVVQIPSNDPIEDDHAEKIIEVPPTVAPTDDASPSDWMFWGVFDGHSGWTTSAKLREVLISFVARELNSAYKSAITDPSLKFPTPESIDAAIKKGFVRLDHEIVHESVEKALKMNSKRVAAEVLAPALSGSCALLSFYDSRSKLLRVACTGDSRAVLGRRGATGKWTATALSVDQTGSNVDEEARMRLEHPGEPDVIRAGRVLGGLEPTRAFGDAVYKWSRQTQELLRKNFFTRSHSSLLRTPPYVTAEPVVTTTQVQPEKGDFVVMATDGLWEMLTNEEVVGLVGQWVDEQKRLHSESSTSGQSWLKSWFSGTSTAGLPVEMTEHGDDKSGQRAPIRQAQWGVQPGQHDRFVVKDKNVATHLVRNALGGKNEDQLCALLTLPSPFSRRFRDDLTVEVIFFGEGENTGVVALNEDASAVATSKL